MQWSNPKVRKTKTPDDICAEQERAAEEWLESGLRLTKEDMYPESNY